MKKFFIVPITLILFSLNSCKEDEVDRCAAITDPLTQVQPLKDVVEVTHACADGDLTIYKCRYQNEIVYWFEKPNATDAACRLAVYDCLGALLFDATDEVKVSEFIAGRTECATLWENTCPAITDPLTQVQPLKDLIDGTHACAGGDLTIYSCRYQNETVYYFEKPYAPRPYPPFPIVPVACNLRVYNCFGELLFDATDEANVDEFIATRTDCITLWENTCPIVADPLVDIAPLKSIVAGTWECAPYSHARLYSCMYNDQPAYYFDNFFNSLGTCTYRVYNCFGETIIFGGQNELFNEFFSNKTECVLLWEFP